jgi:hypothetical protein
MNGHEINIPIAKLLDMPETERNLFLILGHLANELSMLKNLFFFCGHSESVDKWQSRANNAQALVMARVLIGKLWEGWLLLQKCFFGSKLSQQYDSLLSAEAKESLSNFKKYFGKDNLIKNLRNNFSFHYSCEEMTKAFAITTESETDELQMYIGDNVGNSLFFASEHIVNQSLLETVLPGKPNEAMELLVKESKQVADWFIHVISGCMDVIAKRYFLNENGQLEISAVDIGSVQAMDEIRVPYFVSAPKNESSSM